MLVGSEGWPVWSTPTYGAPTAIKMNDCSDRKASEHTANLCVAI